VFVSYSTLLSPYDLLSEWYSFMEVEKHFPQEQAFVQRFLEIVHASEDQGALSLSSFLEYWDNHTEEERVPMPENMEAVRLMTIHKAKGLEAKVVIFPWQQKQMRVDRDIVYKDIEDPNLDLDLHLALRRETIVPEEYYEDYVKRFTESFHLLYVATTRAKEELYVLHIKSGNEEKDSLLQLMEKANLEFPYKAGQKSALTKIVTQEEYPLYQVEVKESKDLEAWHPMHWLPRLKVTKVTPEEPQAQAKDFGVLFHAALEFVASNYEDPVQSADQALRYALWHTRLKHLVAKDLVENLRESLVWLLSQPLMRKWLSIGFREHSLLTSKGKLLRCDLLVPRDTDWLVVDYKSGEVDEQHLGQMRGYLRGVKSEAKKATGLLVYLEDRLFQKVTLTNASSRVLRLEELGF
ncbi:MAG: PD-(D/E)XK nuclease family protein, partial [Desulfovibrionaceae bacterium]|nr:PD-(D/E)XK nuclease family protein [Desulfovibrionaceae bacterium]